MEQEQKGIVIDLASRRDPVMVYERKYENRREVTQAVAWKRMADEMGRIERHLLLGGNRMDAVEAMRDLIGCCLSWSRRL